MTQLGEVQYLDGKPITDARNRHTRRSFLVTSAAAGTLGLLRFGSSSYAEPPASLSFPRPRPLRLETPQPVPSALTFRKRSSSISAGALPQHAGPASDATGNRQAIGRYG